MARAPLNELPDWELEHDEQYIYGWPVVDGAGTSHGTVYELIVDTEQERVVEIVTDTGERFDPHDVDILDKVVSLHEAGGVENAGSRMSGSERPPAPVEREIHDIPMSDMPDRSTVAGSAPAGGSHLGASMASASPEEGNILPTEESGPPTIQMGRAATGGAISGASAAERRSPRIRRIAMDHQLPEHSPNDHRLPDAQQPPDHQLEA